MSKYKIEPLASGEWILKEFKFYEYRVVGLATYKTPREAEQAAKNLSRKPQYIEIEE